MEKLLPDQRPLTSINWRAAGSHAYRVESWCACSMYNSHCLQTRPTNNGWRASRFSCSPLNFQCVPNRSCIKYTQVLSCATASRLWVHSMLYCITEQRIASSNLTSKTGCTIAEVPTFTGWCAADPGRQRTAETVVSALPAGIKDWHTPSNCYTKLINSPVMQQ